MKDLVVVIDNKPIDCTYFRTSDVAPILDGDTLTIQQWRGSRRSWGTPAVRSDIYRLSDNVINVVVTGWHKWTVKPVGGNYYFVRDTSGWHRRTANYSVVKTALAAIR